MDFENYSLRRQNTNLQCELTLTRKILNMQLEIDSLREEVNGLRNKNTRLKMQLAIRKMENKIR